MNAQSLSTVLLVSTLVSMMLLLVLGASRLSLGDAARGSGVWMAGDLLQCLARLWLIGSLGAGLVPTVEAWLHPWHDLQGAIGLHLAGFWCRWVALRQVQAARTPSRQTVVLVALALILAWPLLMAPLPQPGMCKAAALLAIALGVLAQLMATVPLARQNWAARLMLATDGLGALHLLEQLVSLVGSADPWTVLLNQPMARNFLAELLGSTLGTMCFVLILQERLRQRIVEVSVTDALTGAYNRHGLLPILRRELHASLRRGQPVAVVLFDLDHFKRINDQYGHGVGDAVLRAVAGRMRASTRPRDALGRWGGEEFLLVLPELDIPAATQVAERVAQALRGEAVDTGTTPPLRLTVSAGVACSAHATAPTPSAAAAHPSDASLLDTLLDALVDQADRCLYQAKRQRDCVVAHDSVQPTSTPAAPTSPSV